MKKEEDEEKGKARGFGLSKQCFISKVDHLSGQYKHRTS